MKKKSLLVKLISLAILTLSVTGCGFDQSQSKDYTNDQRYEIYELAVKSGYTGTYEEWLESIHGQDGHSPVINIGSDGYWYIDGVNTNVKAQGHQGASLLTGNGVPTVSIGMDGDSYINIDTWDYYLKSAGDWVYRGNIRGENGDIGDKGLSAYEIYLKYHPDYQGNEEEWINDFVSGHLEGREIEETGKFIFGRYMDGTSYCLISYTGNDMYVDIPKTYNGFPVRGIWDNAFLDATFLRNVVINENIEYIGESAFEGCTALNSVVVPDSVTYIGKNAFKNCPLISITLPFIGSDVKSTATFSYLFGDTMPAIVEVVLSDNCTFIPNNAFKNVASLVSCDCGQNITSIGNSAFEGCSKFMTINIPNAVTIIGNNAFKGCSSLKNINIPEKVSSIGANAFDGCSSLSFVLIPASVNMVGSKAFNGCNRLTIAVLRENDEDWDNDWNYSNRPTLFGYNNTETIDGYTYIFGKVGDKKSAFIIDVDASLKEFAPPKVINEYAVMGMDINIFYTKQRFSRIEIPYGVESIPDNMFNHNNDIRFLVLSDTVTSVGVNAFAYCEHLLSVTLGKAMTTFGNSAFASCYRLVQLINHSSLNITHEDDYKYGYVSQATRQIISNEEDSKLFVDDNSFVVYRDNTVYLIDYFGPERDVVVPNEVNRIGKYALFGNPMTSITLGENTTYIEAEALRRCSNLKKIVLPNTFYRAESTALLNCPKLQYNEYDNGRYLGNDVNPYVYLGGVINNSITSFKFHPDCRTSVPKLFEESSSTLEHVDFGSSLVRIESQTTYNCRQLKTMVIPATVTYLGMYNFRGLDSLTDVFYGGSSYEEWAEFFANADYGNAVDTNLVRYYSETSPSDNEYTYWHYVDNVPTVW